MDNHNIGLTTFDEAMKLADAGLDTDTSDMVWLHEEPYETSDAMFDGIHQALCVPYSEYDSKHGKYRNISYFPCWSVGSLLNLLPNKIEDFDLIITRCNSGLLDVRYIRNLDETLKHSMDVVDMVLWLIDNNYISKHEKQ